MLATAEPETTTDTPTCLYCGGTDLRPLYRGVKDRFGYVPGEREFRECRACFSAVQVPLPKAEQLPAFYPPVYSFTKELGQNQGWVKRTLAQLEYKYFFRQQYLVHVRQVMAAAGLKSGVGKKLLDVGCGRGLRLLDFRDRGFEVHGLDMLSDVVRYLNEELKIPAVCADVGALPDVYPADTFDIVTAFYLLEHVPDVRTVLEDCFTVLKPGGWVAGAVPLVDCIQSRMFGGKWTNVIEAPRHLSLPTQEGIIRLYRDIGYEDVKILPDSTLNCAGQIGMSALPGCSLTHVYGGSKVWPLIARFIGAGMMLASAPLCYLENHWAKRVSLGIVCGRKPG